MFNMSETRSKDRKNTFAFLRDTVMSVDAYRLLLDADRNVVYFFYGDDDKLLYVGRAKNFSLRWRQHLQSEKEMMQVKKVCLHIFETKPETMFYEAQKIAMLKPLWNIVGVDALVAKNMIEPQAEAWFECRLTATEDETDEILAKMELLYSEDWFARHTDEQLKEEFYHLHRRQQGELVFHPLEPTKIKEEIPPDATVYKVIKRKEKDKKTGIRTVHIWQGKDTLCQAVSKYKLKTANYWFNDTKKLTEDLCPLCKAQMDAQ